MEFLIWFAVPLVIVAVALFLRFCRWVWEDRPQRASKPPPRPVIVREAKPKEEPKRKKTPVDLALWVEEERQRINDSLLTHEAKVDLLDKLEERYHELLTRMYEEIEP